MIILIETIYLNFQFQQTFGNLIGLKSLPPLVLQNATANSYPLDSNSPQLKYEQQLSLKLGLALLSLVLGLFYSVLGYRCLKLATFLVGLALGSSVLYLILSEQRQLSWAEQLVLSVAIGVLFAFVALLVHCIGLFLLGVASSVTVATFILVLVDLFYTNKSAWLCMGLLFACATLVASLALRFQRPCAVLNTASLGATLLLAALDFFVENNLLLDYVLELYRVNGHSFNMFERQRALLRTQADFRLDAEAAAAAATVTSSFSSLPPPSKAINATLASQHHAETAAGSGGALALVLQLYSSAHARLCWYTWCTFGSYFAFLFAGLLVQFAVTAKNHDHRGSWHRSKRRNTQ